MKKVNFELNKTNIIKKIKTGVYIIQVEDKTCVLKMSRFLRQDQISGIKKIVYNAIFRNELRINYLLKEKEYKHFNFPRLLMTDDKNYMINEYVNKQKNINLNNETKEKLILGLLEFQLADIQVKINVKDKIIFKFIQNTYLNIIRYALMGIAQTSGIKVGVQCIITFIKLERKVDRIKTPINLHNDLVANTLLSKDDNIYFIDFEGFKKEDKLILEDIISWSFDKDNFNFDLELLDKYLDLLCTRLNIKPRKLNLKIQIRIILLRTMLRSISSKSKNDERRINHSKFLINIILSDVNYEKWYLKNVGILF